MVFSVDRFFFTFHKDLKNSAVFFLKKEEPDHIFSNKAYTVIFKKKSESGMTQIMSNFKRKEKIKNQNS